MTVFIIIWSAWLVAEIALNRLLRADNKNKKDFDNGSTRTIWRIIGIANSLAIACACLIKFPISKSIIIPYTGVAFIILGMILRVIAIKTLGKFFTVNVNISENHKIVETGLYKYIRHPSYLGAIISFSGFGLSLNNWLSLIIVVVLVTGVMIYRINIEEQALLGTFGEAYKSYMKKTFRLIPWVY